MQLRAYQKDAIDQIRRHFKNGRRKVLLHLATGGGKTHIFSYILKHVVSKGKKGIMVVRGRHLVSQASDRLTHEGVEHGVLMARHWNYNPTAPIQICSIDTLRTRQIVPEADIVVIDEAHYAVSKSYHDLVAKYPAETYFLPVTATPYTHKSLSHIADVVVKPISFEQLVEQDYLVSPQYYAPFVPDLKGVGVSRSTGDFKEDELSEFMEQKAIVGNLVDNWFQFSYNEPTICFAVTIKHSQYIVEKFNERGVAAVHIEANTKDYVRKEKLAELKAGKIKVISNVGILCTGVDMPYVRTILMARPTESYNLYIQQAGRGTRPYEDKTHFKLLDCAGNIFRHGYIEDEKDVNLEANDRESDRSPDLKTCPICFAIVKKGVSICPVCKYIFNAKDVEREVSEIEGELKRIERNNKEIEIRMFIKKCKETMKCKGYKRGWIFYQVKHKYGEDVAQKYVPKRVVPDWIRR